MSAMMVKFFTCTISNLFYIRIILAMLCFSAALLTGILCSFSTTTRLCLIPLVGVYSVSDYSHIFLDYSHMPSIPYVEWYHRITES